MHLLEADQISKYYGNVVALKDISTYVDAGEVTCILGDNGAGKSSFIKILSGVHQADAGRLLVDDEEVHFTSPRDARAKGIATVYQDLAMVPLMSVWRNFFLGAEPRKGFSPIQWFDSAKAKSIVRREVGGMGIDIRDPDQAVGTLSGGERQSVAIARAVYFRARVVILDEPTSALGVKQAGGVLEYGLQAPERSTNTRPSSRLYPPAPSASAGGSDDPAAAAPPSKPAESPASRSTPMSAASASSTRAGTAETDPTAIRASATRPCSARTKHE